jgi:hypothetical protein
MQENCTECDFRVGDSVDWYHVGNASRQKRFWHGVIVDDWNSTREGHWFVVRWEMSNAEGAYRGPKPDADPRFVPRVPHFVEEECTELRRCGAATDLHPSVNALPFR